MNQYQNSIAALHSVDRSQIVQQQPIGSKMPGSAQNETGPQAPQQSSLTQSSVHLHNYSQRLIERANRDRVQLEMIKGKVVSKLTPLRGGAAAG